LFFRKKRLNLYLRATISVMEYLYTLGIFLLRLIYGASAWFSSKARAFRDGRIAQKEALAQSFPLHGGQLVWFHCSSLGEFEQGRPVMEALKAWRPELKLLLTFFSPSGYAVRKNYEHADFVFYLPWDTRSNAHWFAQTVRPSLVIFVKYEFWYHYTKALRQENIPVLSIATIFRPGQIFFKAHGSLFRSLLRNFHFFFVQNPESVELLRSIGINTAAVAGDTRFDRVHEASLHVQDLDLIRRFKGDSLLMVLGSVWPRDMKVLIPFIREQKELKFIIAPHEIHESFLKEIERAVDGRAVRYSQLGNTPEHVSILLVDNVGLLSQLYRFGDVAFVGGGFGEGLHNILEAACFGAPVFFGNKAYAKYQEATDLIERGGAFAVSDQADLKKKYQALMENPKAFDHARTAARQYIQENLGATEKITTYCKKLLG